MKSILLLAALLALIPVARATVTETFRQTYPLAAGGAVHLENVNGDIKIIAWDKAEVSLEAEKRGKTEDDLQRVTFEIDAQPDRLSIRTKYEKKSTGHGNIDASVRYQLMVPAGTRLDKITSVNSDITVTGVRGTVSLSTTNGRIEANGLTADATLKSTNGNLSAKFASLDKVQDVKLRSTNGRAEVTLPKGASARVETSTVNGSNRIDQPIKLSKSGRHGLSGDIGQGGPTVSVETVNGSIAIREE